MACASFVHYAILQLLHLRAAPNFVPSLGQLLLQRPALLLPH